jgi:dipeptidyl aminopeptidase/acylaminoacyl peptidase
MPRRVKPSGKVPVRFSRCYWMNIARFVALCAALGLVVLFAHLVVMGVRLARHGLHPARLPLDRSPREVGIEHYQDVFFVTADGLTLRGWYVPSQNGAAVILGHGHAANRTQLLPEATILARHGYGVLLFDWRAHGESEGDTTTLGDRERQDLDAAIDLVATRPEVDPERIGALGFSMGAATVTLSAAHDPRLRAVVVEAAYPTLREEVRFFFRAIPLVGPIATLWSQLETGSDLDAARPVDEICAISPRPLLLIYGTDDGEVPPGSAHSMFAAACEPKALWLVEGAGHGGYLQVVPQEYERRLVAFFDEALAPR